LAWRANRSLTSAGDDGALQAGGCTCLCPSACVLAVQVSAKSSHDDAQREERYHSSGTQRRDDFVDPSSCAVVLSLPRNHPKTLLACPVRRWGGTNPPVSCACVAAVEHSHVLAPTRPLAHPPTRPAGERRLHGAVLPVLQPAAVRVVRNHGAARAVGATQLLQCDHAAGRACGHGVCGGCARVAGGASGPVSARA
jgi:hypothetical protein